MPEIPTGWDHPPTSTSSPYHHEDDLAYTVKASATVMASNSQKPTALDQADHRVADYPFPMTPGPSPYYSPAVTPNLVPMSTPNLSAEVYREVSGVSSHELIVKMPNRISTQVTAVKDTLSRLI